MNTLYIRFLLDERGDETAFIKLENASLQDEIRREEEDNKDHQFENVFPDTDPTLINLKVEIEEPPLDKHAVGFARRGRRRRPISGHPGKRSKPVDDAVSYQCAHCAFVSADTQRLKQHETAVHGAVITQHCTLCDFYTTKTKLLKIHKRSKHGPMFPCSQCDYSTARSYDLRLLDRVVVR